MAEDFLLPPTHSCRLNLDDNSTIRVDSSNSRYFARNMYGVEIRFTWGIRGAHKPEGVKDAWIGVCKFLKNDPYGEHLVTVYKKAMAETPPVEQI